uniref:Transmembrane protein 241 n=1 Tax=Poecilia reticulata TaxID=8081 RepID=A0A3P9P1P1_POERE
FVLQFVLSVLKFTYPTLFQWQTLIGAALLLLSGKLGWVEMSRIPSAALSWLPGSFLFVGNIYAGSRALSRIDIPFFFTLQNSSHVVSYIIARTVHREFDHSGYVWALCHLFCVAYRAFRVHKSTNLDIEQQCINYVLLLGLAAHPTDISGALEFPSLQSHMFHCGCCAR